MFLCLKTNIKTNSMQVFNQLLGFGMDPSCFKLQNRFLHLPAEIQQLMAKAHCANVVFMKTIKKQQLSEISCSVLSLCRLVICASTDSFLLQSDYVTLTTHSCWFSTRVNDMTLACASLWRLLTELQLHLRASLSFVVQVVGGWRDRWRLEGLRDLGAPDHGGGANVRLTLKSNGHEVEFVRRIKSLSVRRAWCAHAAASTQ